MKLEEAYILEVMKVMGYVESKVDPLIQIVRSHQHKTNSTILQNARSLKEKLQNGKTKIKDIISGKRKKDGKEKEHMDKSHVS